MAEGIELSLEDVTEARPFCERLGYEVFGELDDFPPGHARYFMK
jgi:hypothetical protein